MGAGTSQLEKQIGEQFPPNERYFGLANFGNTCYCNSVLQALYFCKPFRDKVLEYKSKNKRNNKETLLTCLADLFHNIATQKKKTGTIAPKKFVAKLRKENQLFDNYHQQDAHEFLNYLLNTIADLLNEEQNEQSKNLTTTTNTTTNDNTVINNQSQTTKDQLSSTNSGTITANNINSSSSNNSNNTNKTWIYEIFQGTLTNETRCLNCESLSSKDEDFLDLSVEILANSSITHCLDVFSNTETLSSEHKYYCENCCSKQEAQKRMLIKKSPMILALHLKRFKYMETQNRHTKLTYRVVFPLELRICNRTGNDDKLYDLVAVVIHCGPGPNRGHYISMVKSFGLWLLFDDELVEKIEAYTIEDFFGLANDQKSSESGYILFYQSRE